MIPRWFPLTLSAVAFVPGFLHAQQAYPNAQPQRVQTVIAQPQHVERTFIVEVPATQNEKMYEDIEILRRILDRKLTPLYPSIPSTGGRTEATIYGTLLGAQDGNPGTLLVTPDGHYQLHRQTRIWNADQPPIPGWVSDSNNLSIMPYPATIPLRSLEGIYLKGQGVVYTATLASLQPAAKAETDSSIKEGRVAVLQRDSEWDSIRRQVRKEKDEPKKPEESKPPTLSDVLLRVLADNGHNFSQLGENESLTIILTVHEESPSSPAAKSGTGSTRTESKPAPADSDADRQREARNLELLGELHLKQAKYEEAKIVFQRMLERATSLKQAAEARRKLSQCYLMQGQDEKALDELDQAIQLMRRKTEAKEKSAPAAKKVAALPVKLIISAPKKLLDQVKEGKISFEDFRRQASVETLRFGDRR